MVAPNVLLQSSGAVKSGAIIEMGYVNGRRHHENALHCAANPPVPLCGAVDQPLLVQHIQGADSSYDSNLGEACVELPGDYLFHGCRNCVVLPMH